VKKSVVGICLGAQIIANALGARVYPGPQKEIGWFDIETTSDYTTGSFRFPEKTTVFHWHGETFDLPPGAARLAKSSVCENQAFQVGKNVIGLQFPLVMGNPNLFGAKQIGYPLTEALGAQRNSPRPQRLCERNH